MSVDVNFMAVGIAAISSMVIGYFWYGSSKFGFGKKWSALAGIEPKKSNSPMAMIFAAISSLVMAYGLAYATFIIHDYFQGDYFISALQVGLFVWVCFQGIRMYQRSQFNQESQAESFIHVSNEFFTVLVMALIIGLFGV